MKLFFRETGTGKPVVILHGLFGSSDNWVTQAKMLGSTFNVYTIDLPNHGQSPHTDSFDYPSMVHALEEFFADQKLTAVTLIGHSMGGKAAMNYALVHSQHVDRLIVVDIAPRAYNLEHYTIAEGLAAIPIETITSRNEADAMLAQYVPEADTRQFLLKNLQRKPDGGFTWKINLPVIKQKLSNIGLDLQYTGTFDKPTLFIAGSRSNYIRDVDWQRITQIFPNAELQTLETGHWVQAEKPKEFCELVTQWINSHETINDEKRG